MFVNLTSARRVGSKKAEPSPFRYYLGKTGLAKIIAQLTNSSPFKKRVFNRRIRFLTLEK